VFSGKAHQSGLVYRTVEVARNCKRVHVTSETEEKEFFLDIYKRLTGLHFREGGQYREDSMGLREYWIQLSTTHILYCARLCVVVYSLVFADAVWCSRLAYLPPQM